MKNLELVNRDFQEQRKKFITLIDAFYQQDNKRIAYNDKVSLRYSVKAKNSNNDNVYLTCSESNKIAKENI